MGGLGKKYPLLEHQWPNRLLQILVDGVDISGVGLRRLRSHLTIIPQDPVLFSGTLRFNLDPAGASSDGDLWRALGHAHLGEHVAGLPSGLDHQVSGEEEG